MKGCEEVDRMSYMIGELKVNREVYWRLTDAQRQKLHDRFAPGTTAIPFDPRFAEKYDKNPNGPF